MSQSLKSWTSVQVEFVGGSIDAEGFVAEIAGALGACGAAQSGTGEEWTLYFAGDADGKTIVSAIKSAARERGLELSGRLVVGNVEKQNWGEAWREYFHPVQVSERIRVLPAWMTDRVGDGINLLIEPGMAFGTGTHETTQLCMCLLEKHVQQGDRVLDAGTGTGILGICAVKLGATYALGFDVDPDIRENAALNVKLNGAEQQVHLFTGPLQAVRGEFDLILCNMITTQFMPLLSDLARHGARGATLILSGLLCSDEPEVVRAVSALDWQVIDQQSQGMWAALACKQEETLT